MGERMLQLKIKEAIVFCKKKGYLHAYELLKNVKISELQTTQSEKTLLGESYLNLANFF